MLRVILAAIVWLAASVAAGQYRQDETALDEVLRLRGLDRHRLTHAQWIEYGRILESHLDRLGHGPPVQRRTIEQADAERRAWIASVTAQPQQVAMRADQIPPAVLARAPQVCMVVVEEGRTTGYGSGVAVSERWVFSAAHVFRDAGLRPGAPCVCTFPSGQIRGELRGWHSGLDFAAVQLSQDLPDAATIPTGSAPEGTPLYLAGHPTAQLRQDWFRAVSDGGKRYLRNLLATGHGAIPGHSGGPVLTADGVLVGIISATDDANTFCVPLDQVADAGYLPADYVQFCQPRGAGGNRIILSPFARQGTCPPAGSSAPIRPAPIAGGAQGPPGPAGPQGPPGPAGPPGQIDLEQLAAILARDYSDVLRGPAGPAGKDGRDAEVKAYVDPGGQLFINSQYVGDVRGPKGEPGRDGKDGASPSLKDAVILRVEYADKETGRVYATENFRAGDTLILYSGKKK